MRSLVPNIPTISQHDLNPGLKLANPGIIEKVASFAVWSHLQKGGDCLTLVLCILKPFVASRWVLQLRYFDRICRDLRFGISQAKDLSDLSWLERCWSDAHSLNARLTDSIGYIESSQSYLDLKGPALRTLSRKGRTTGTRISNISPGDIMTSRDGWST